MIAEAIAGYPRLAEIEPLVRIAFVLDRAPISLNRTYGAAHVKRMGKDGTMKDSAMMFKHSDAKDQQTALHTLAVIARNRSGWPSDIWTPAHVRISYYAVNTYSDAASNSKLVADAFEGVLYQNDRVVSWGEIPKPEWDATGAKRPRIEFIIDLLSTLTEEGARSVERGFLERAVKSAKRRKKPMDTALAEAALADFIRRNST